LTRVARATVATKADVSDLSPTRRQKPLDTRQRTRVKSREAKPRRHQSIVRAQRPAEAKGYKPVAERATPRGKNANSIAKRLQAKTAAGVRPTPKAKAGRTVSPSKPTVVKAKPATVRAEPVIAKQLESTSRQSPRAVGGGKSLRLNARESLATQRPRKAPKAPEAVRTLGPRGKSEAAVESRVRPRQHSLNIRKIGGLDGSSKPTRRAPKASSRAVEKELSPQRPRSEVAHSRSTRTAVKPSVKQGSQPAIPSGASGPRTQVTASRPGSRASASVKSAAMENALLSKPGLDDLSNTRESTERTKVVSEHPRPSRPVENAQRQNASRRSKAVEVSKTDTQMSSRQDSGVAKADVKGTGRAGAEEYAVKATDSAVKKELISSLTKAPDARAEARPIASDKPSTKVAARAAVSENASTPSNKRQPSVVRSSAAPAEAGRKHETSTRAGAAPRLEPSARPVDDAPHRPSRADVQTRIAPPSDSPGTNSDSRGAITQPVERTEDSSNRYFSKEESLSGSDREHRNLVRTPHDPPRWMRAGNEGSTRAAEAAARPPAPVQSNGSAGAVNTKAVSGQVVSQGLRDALPVDAGVEVDAKPSSAQQSQEMFQGIPPELRADDGALGGFRTILGAPRALISQVAARIRRLHRSGRQEMRIRLNPPELGAMRIRIRVMNNGVKATLMVEQPQAHALLEESMPALLRALHEQGLKVDSLSVEVSHGADEFELSSQSDGKDGERGYGSVRSDEPWREAVDETMLPAAAELSGSRLLDVVA